jgi:hypothetical protein
MKKIMKNGGLKIKKKGFLHSALHNSYKKTTHLYFSHLIIQVYNLSNLYFHFINDLCNMFKVKI